MNPYCLKLNFNYKYNLLKILKKSNNKKIALRETRTLDLQITQRVIFRL